MNPEVLAMKKRIRKNKPFTKIRCLDCGHIVVTDNIGQFKRCPCGAQSVWQHPTYMEVLTKDRNYLVLEEYTPNEGKKTRWQD